MVGVGEGIEGECPGWMRGRYNTREGEDIVLKVGELVEARKPDKG